MDESNSIVNSTSLHELGDHALHHQEQVAPVNYDMLLKTKNTTKGLQYAYLHSIPKYLPINFAFKM